VIDMSARNTASIVICTHSEARLPLLRQSLKSVLDQQDGPYDVIVVIDHNPGLLATVAAEFAGVQVVANSHAQGLSGARNTGVGVARGDIVAFLDDDALAPPDWMARLQAHYGDRSVIGVGGRIDAVWTNGRPSWFAREFDWVVGCSYLGLPETPGPVRNLIGCNMSFRRAIFSMVGSFPEGQGRSGDNGAGCEETDFCIRAGSAFPGARIIYDPGIAVRHVLSRHRQTWSYFLRRCVQEGRSKAHLTTTLGARSGLATERQYLRRTLPKGVWRGLCDPFRLDWTGPLRSTAILLGLAGVGWGYALGRLKKTDGPRVQDNFAPIRIVEVDLDGPRVGIKAVDAKTGQRYGGAFCAVRSGGELVDLVEVPLYGVNLPADALSEVLARTRRTMVPAEVRPAPPPPDSFARIVIATRDRPDSLAKCLDSLLAQSHQNFEIVVVDNCPSSAATRDLIATYYAGTGRIHYRREDRAGLGHAHNAGLLGNAAGVVAFTDDDVRVDSRWLSALLRNFVGSERVGCVTGLILPAELETRAQYWTERHGGFGKGLERRVFDLGEHRLPGPLFPFAAGNFGSGANMAFSREALEAVGGFDGALGAGTLARGGDDLASFVSVIQAGYQIVYEPQAIVWHHHRRGADGMERQAYGYGVGLGAYLTKFLVEKPGTAWHYLRALPAGALHLMGGASPKNARLPPDYPPHLRWSERRGIVAGLPAYLRSRASFRRYQRELPHEGSAGE
jgi:O-antigen biosynthesis protein